MAIKMITLLKKRHRMTNLFRSDFISRFLIISLVILLFLGSFPIVMGEDSIVFSKHDLNVELGTIHQLEVTIGEPVIMYQELKITNTNNQTINASILLSDYPEQLPEVYLNEYVSLSITSEGEMHSAQPVLPISLGPYQSKEYILEYEFVPVYKEVLCEEITIQDYLPEDSQILPSSLPPETVIEKKCNVRIHHDGEIHYYNVEVSLEELEGEKINSIYYVEEDQYLKLENGVISLTR
jgi:hypothetical protein